MKRLVAIALTLILCLSLCFFAAAEETDVYGKYEEPIKLTILSEDFKTGNTNYDANDPRRASATQNVWIDAYKDYLNIDVERQIAEDETALAALINTAMASGDLPDVIICNKAMFYTLVENGVLQDVRAAYEGYQQKRLVKDALDSLDMWDACTVDGQLLAVPCVNNFYNNTQILWIRQDWLDKVNMEAPRTLDEMIAVAQAFKDAKLGGEDTIGIAMTGTTSHNYDAILAAYGAIAGCWQPKEDGTYEYAYVSDTAREGLLKMQEIYEKGLVVPDMAVCDDKTVAEQIANGRAGMYYATGWHVVTDMKTSMVNDPEAVWTCVAAPSVDGERFKQWTNANCHTFTCVTTACKNPEAVFKMMELEQHMYTLSHVPAAECVSQAQIFRVVLHGHYAFQRRHDPHLSGGPIHGPSEYLLVHDPSLRRGHLLHHPDDELHEGTAGGHFRIRLYRRRGPLDHTDPDHSAPVQALHCHGVAVHHSAALERLV